MGVLFDESTSNYLSCTDVAALDLPNSDWCVSFWESTTDNTGGFFQYMFSNNGTTTAANAMNIFWNEASASNPNRMVIILINSSGTTILNSNVVGENLSSNTFSFSGVPRLWVFQRTGSNFEAWVCTIGGTASQEMAYTSANWTAISFAALEFARRVGGTANRAYGGTMGHIFSGDFALSQNQIEDLAGGSSIFDLGKTPRYYLPLAEDVATQPDLVGGLTVTRNGTLANGIEFPVFLEGPVYVNYTPAAGAGQPVNINGIGTSYTSWNGVTTFTSWNGVT